MTTKHLYNNLFVSVEDSFFTNPNEQRPSSIGDLVPLFVIREDNVEKAVFDSDLTIGEWSVEDPATTEYERLIELMTGKGSLGKTYISLDHYFYVIDRLGDEAAKRTLQIRLNSLVKATSQVDVAFPFIFYKKEMFKFPPSKDQEQLDVKLVENRPLFLDWLTTNGALWREVEPGAEEL